MCNSIKEVKRIDVETCGSEHSWVFIRYEGTMEEAVEAVKEQYTTRCMHEYDCCGHWYSTFYNHKSIHTGKGSMIAYIAYYQNI
jgi:hypothetical protein